MSSLYYKSLDKDAARRYKEKLNVKGVILPDPLDEGLRNHIFQNDYKKLPDLLHGDIFIYLVVSKKIFTIEEFKNYKSLESYNFFLSGKVFDLNIEMIYCKLEEACPYVGALLFAIEVAARKYVTNSVFTCSLPCCLCNTSKKKRKKLVEQQRLQIDQPQHEREGSEELQHDLSSEQPMIQSEDQDEGYVIEPIEEVEIIPAADIDFGRKNRKRKSESENPGNVPPSDKAYAKFFKFLKAQLDEV